MPAPYAISDFANAIPNVLADSGNMLYPAAGADQSLTDVLTPFICRALDRYSRDCPLVIVSDWTADGTQQMPLPVYPDVVTTAVPVFDPLFSTVVSIEWPILQQPPEFIDDNDQRLYQTPAGFVILLTADTPNAGDTLRTTWTARHAIDGSTVPDKDFNALVDFAASLAAEQIATIYAQTMDPSVGADVVNYRGKSTEYQGIAARLRKRYFNQLGVDENATGAAENKPAIAIGQQYFEMQSGVDRLIHNRYSR